MDLQGNASPQALGGGKPLLPGRYPRAPCVSVEASEVQEAASTPTAAAGTLLRAPICGPDLAISSCTPAPPLPGSACEPAP